ncbi:hypothetical protein EB796_001579 [Bugula neritina]|uniref:Uncharacterized protein n=1 Tax=Bugula neritina TaxID=10212 RepID=A0A7J7KPK1_BUGNE|nr:hypothetical protein EB796_001579 [Bugula neritina]
MVVQCEILADCKVEKSPSKITADLLQLLSVNAINYISLCQFYKITLLSSLYEELLFRPETEIHTYSSGIT